MYTEAPYCFQQLVIHETLNKSFIRRHKSTALDHDYYGGVVEAFMLKCSNVHGGIYAQQLERSCNKLRGLHHPLRQDGATGAS